MCKPQVILEKVKFLCDLIVMIMIITMITRVGFDDKEMKQQQIRKEKKMAQ